MPGNDLKGAAEPMGREAWWARVLWRLLHPHYSPTAKRNGLQGSVVLQQGSFLLL